MTTREHGERIGPALQGEDHDINSLPAGSYTAQRLKHASAQHLHLTTRRIFIGPIPEEWIASHRKSWAKYRPRMLTYSSRSATFNAAQTVSEFRALTGLDSDGSRTQRDGLSFPQPSDVNDEEPDVNLVQQGVESSVNNGSAQASRSDQSDQQDASGATASSAPQLATSGDTESYVTAATRLQDSKTFVTAREDLNSNFENSEPQSNDSQDAISQRTGNTPDSPTVRKRDLESSSDIRRNGGSESTEALLSQEEIRPPSRERNSKAERAVQSKKREYTSLGDRPNVKKQPSKQDVLLEVEPEAYNDEARRADVVHAERVTSGMVRFELPEAVTSRGHAIRGRISEAKGKVVSKNFGNSKAEPGQLLKAERMLVRIEFSKHELEKGYSERDSARAETNVLEKWREYMVTCRKAATEDGFVLDMSKTRVLPMLATERTSKKAAHQIKLQPHITRANFFSSLDKTIVIWEPKRKGTRIYILRPRSSASSVEWFTFLNLILGWKTPDLLKVSVPDLDVGLEIYNPLRQNDIDRVVEGDVSVEQDEQTRLTDGHVAKNIIGKALQTLETSEFHDILRIWEERHERLGLAWRQYDRLEWVHGASEERMYGALSMQDTHELEIRTKVHYPTSITQNGKDDGTQLEEPAPIEGFLVRQTSQKGRNSLMGRNFFKKLYFSTHNHLLCYLTPGKAVPPKPPGLLEALDEGSQKAKVLAKRVPLIYNVDPYPLKDGKISWMTEGNLTKRKESDQQAYEESERSMHLMLEAEGYINMCHIKKVRKYKPKKDGPLADAVTDEHEDSESENEDENTSAAAKHDIERSFQVHLNNGLIIRLQAYDKVARKEWVKQLRQLSSYWKLRTAGDIDLYKEVKQQNIDGLGIDEQMESIVGQTAEKWEVSKSVASPELFHMCGISCCRQITMSGTLYRKPRLHSSFKKCMVVLCHGRLLVFQATLRSTSGHVQPHILHEREEVVDLKDSYIYSGSLTEDDLLYQNKTFDSNHPGHNALPRVFRDDNWTSVDEDSTTCFVVWHGRRSMLSQVRYVSSLGVPGRSMVFKTRSRAERDHWVTNISMEIERLQQTEDVRIVVSK